MFSQRLLTFVSLVVSAYGLISQTELEENTAKGLRLISLQDGVDPIWMTEEEKLRLMADDTNFVCELVQILLLQDPTSLFLTVRCHRILRS